MRPDDDTRLAEGFATPACGGPFGRTVPSGRSLGTRAIYGEHPTRV